MHASQYAILNIKNYFEIAEEYAILEKKYRNLTINFWIDMVIYPVFLVLSVVFLGQSIGIFTVMSIHKTVTKWQEYVHYLILKQEIREWKTVAHSIGGPFISTNDTTYQSYVYADSMHRLLGSLLTKKGSKCI